MSGAIGSGDFTIWRSNLGKLVPNVSASGAGMELGMVPEPRAITLVLNAVAAIYALRRGTRSSK
jgi:hypothetical protein